MFKGNFVSVIVTAAGSGTRMVGHENKLWINLKGKKVLERTLENLLSSSIPDELILVVSDSLRLRVESELLPRIHLGFPVKLVPGGKERQDSMYNGLGALDSRSTLVVSHDGARPFVDERMLRETLEALENYGGAVVGVPCKDTIKVVREKGEVVATPNRKHLYAIQTPQAFRRETLEKAYAIAKEEDIRVTDDASLVEKIGVPVKVVLGSYDNIKITTPEDILLAELILKEENHANRNGL